jgi:hypothetical protein
MGLGIISGAAAGAAGTTALNAVAYADMALRGRPVSNTPERTVETVADHSPFEIPGRGETRDNRVSGLGALSGIATGVAVGAAFGVLHRLGVRPHPLLGAALTGLAAMVATDASMAALKVSDPRRWSATDWLSDLVPHLAYGAVTWLALRRLQDR